MISAQIVLDSISETGVRLTTFELIYPRFIHQEVLTHRVFSRNSASSRAIPAKELAAAISANPAMPIHWGLNQSGMSASREVDNPEEATAWWLESLELMLAQHRKGVERGYHKQVVNRILEPWMHMQVLLSSTFFDNFYHLRDAAEAQPEIAALARGMRDAQARSTPTLLRTGEWHMPLIHPEELSLPLDVQRKLSASRCARVSYTKHREASDVEKDLKRYERLRTSGHWSPFEHVAESMGDLNGYANMCGFRQLRTLLGA